MDVDGVLTQGQIVYDHAGNEIKFFHVHDGFGIVLLRKAGFKTAILTARFAQAVAVRGKDLQIDKIIQDAHPKTAEYKKLLKEFKMKDEQVCFIADDLPDLGVFTKVGLAVAVPNAVIEIKKRAHYITKKNGGCGAVREVIELILKAQGKWETIVKTYLRS